MRSFKRIQALLTPLILALALSGCLKIAGISLPNDGHVIPVVPGGDLEPPKRTIPRTDAELPGHVPSELIVGVQPGTDLSVILQVINADVLDVLEPIHAVRLRLNEGSITDAMRALNDTPHVRYAEPNYTEYYLFETLLPNDPDFYVYQYGPQRLQAPAAWAEGITGRGTIIAVIDTGVDPYHPDLAGNVLLGFNTLLSNYNTIDIDGHGTHVAGIAAAIANNGIGIAGIAPEAKILPLKALDDNGRGSSFSISLAILIAADPTLVPGLGTRPADVINMSLGGPVYSQLQQDAINFALERNVVIVAAAGNDFKQYLAYPAAHSGVIAVTATNAHDEPAFFTSSGPYVSVSAPGYGVYSTIPGGGYIRLSGTSMAAPHVAGAVALIRQKYPDLSPMEVKHLLERTADSPNGFTREMGYGRVNVARALEIEDTTSNRGTLKIVVTDSLGLPIVDADVVLYRDGQMVGNVRTGGYIVGYEGIAYFHDLEPGDGYKVTVRLDPMFHGLQYIKAVENISIGSGEITEITVQLDIP